jgi:hypothetical protein
MKPSFFTLAAVAIVTTLLMIQNRSEDALRHENEALRVEVALLRQEVATLRNRVAIGLRGPVRPIAGTKEVAAITYGFQRMPLVQVFSIYEGLCGKRLVAAPNVDLTQGVHLITAQPLTTNGAMRAIEDALKEQAGAMIVPKDDESLSVVSVPHVSMPSKQ